MRDRVVVVDDHEAVRETLRDLIEGHPRFEVVGEAESMSQALRVVHEQQPNLVLVDLILGPGPHGIQLTKGIKAQLPLCPVLILSGRHESLFAEQALLAGAAGYLMKDDAVDILFDAMEVATAGKIWLSGSMLRYLLPTSIVPTATLGDLHDAVDRALVAELQRGNRSVIGLARALSVAPPRIEERLVAIQHKLGLPSRAALYLFVG